MNRSNLTTVLLVGGLIVSNAWWAFSALDSGVTYTYQQDQLQLERESVTQLLAVSNAIAGGATTKEELVVVASQTANTPLAFEKGGFVWVGAIGLRFDESGEIIELQKSWQ
ncbi:hypothetical protein [Algiphilus sp.]|uniref:hypothetical protein n=1 Tax=Algiphilus sp. TaxID=1872431 RepID=UPI0032EE3623